MINLAEFEAELKEKFGKWTTEDWEKFEKESTKEIDYTHCEYCVQNEKESCGKCMFCGKDGHIRSILFFTGSYCTECYKKKNEEVDEYA